MTRKRTMFRLDADLAGQVDQFMPHLVSEAWDQGVRLDTRNSALEWIIHNHINQTQRRVRIAEHAKEKALV